ncbi:hypothetical protein HPB50_014539 [Hyalomma asiaticum]|uniref:Uncharacterized protein n=1 Tax=Hyalomma asiaticum TaxID=266040 RepID=A0ACB7SHL6_HYAAI|nr:hypothetical protein HPB50_014539 [Hyalomma asiaticum]
MAVIDRTPLPYTLTGPFPHGVCCFQHDGSPVPMAVSLAAIMKGRCVMMLERPSEEVEINIIQGILATIKRLKSPMQMPLPSANNIWAVVEAQ